MNGVASDYGMGQTLTPQKSPKSQKAALKGMGGSSRSLQGCWFAAPRKWSFFSKNAFPPPTAPGLLILLYK